MPLDRTPFVALALMSFVLLATSARDTAAQATKRAAGAAVKVVEVASGLSNPWGLSFLPDGRMLVTERGGDMRLVSAAGEVSAPLGGVPEVHAQGQGGLLDVILGPDFASDRSIFFCYAEPTARGARTAVARAELDVERLRLANAKVIFGQKDDPPGRHHFGCRLVFARDGSLFVTLGDRFNFRDQAQDLSTHFGKIVRIRTDGTAPPDNPFVDRPEALPEVWSYGHRNIQGAALHPETGVLWTHEHGPQGGDEVNVGKPGANYGWPVITYGREYGTGLRIGEGTERADVQPPVHYWIPSIAPSGMAFYTGDDFPQWKGSLFVGALRSQLVARLEIEGGKVVREERLLEDLGSRIRDVRQGPDGKLYLLDESKGRILRLDPA